MIEHHACTKKGFRIMPYREMPRQLKIPHRMSLDYREAPREECIPCNNIHQGASTQGTERIFFPRTQSQSVLYLNLNE